MAEVVGGEGRNEIWRPKNKANKAQKKPFESQFNPILSHFLKGESQFGYMVEEMKSYMREVFMRQGMVGGDWFMEAGLQKDCCCVRDGRAPGVLAEAVVKRAGNAFGCGCAAEGLAGRCEPHGQSPSPARRGCYRDEAIALGRSRSHQFMQNKIWTLNGTE